MNPIQAAQFISNQLIEEKVKLVLLGGSAARGKEKPNDLDIAAVFEKENNLLNPPYRNQLVNRLSSLAGYKIDLIDFNEAYVLNLISSYNENPRLLCIDLNILCMDNVRDQWKGWPLSWIFGGKAREILKPYGCFQDEFKVLFGEDYLMKLRSMVKDPDDEME